ncbi:DUF3592 domain-containing protein [Streptomyces syringium]|uniref:DUF3592 domain-containing protein n=1 Tax=Streptomyces syringium TaxID=76729 RepID=UPI0036682E42
MGFGVWLCASVGVALLGVGVYERTVVSRLRRDGVRTEGIVVRVLVDDGAQRPVIEFTAPGGYLVEFSPTTSGMGLGLDVGSTVPVAYPPGRPQAARVFTARHRVLPSVFSALIGSIFLGAAVLIAMRG